MLDDRHTEHQFYRMTGLIWIHEQKVKLRISWMRLTKTRWWWVIIGGLVACGIIAAYYHQWALAILVAAVFGILIGLTIAWG